MNFLLRRIGFGDCSLLVIWSVGLGRASTVRGPGLGRGLHRAPADLWPRGADGPPHHAPVRALMPVDPTIRVVGHARGPDPGKGKYNILWYLLLNTKAINGDMFCTSHPDLY